ncbi:GNAT family N-acetyltransferase [Halorubellus litoreus]|uniref:GNAT family N-acetyltransferase n=1 Tax=Halorubellus litoreus TaxID=755308 RepID=A0ABD5VED7_9EURY
MSASGDPNVVVREATVEAELDVRRVLDGAMLETDAVSDAVARGDAFVAVDDERVVGALVLVPLDDVALPEAVGGDVGMHVDAVAVRRRRRGRGVGRALVSAALDRERRLTVAFDPGVRAFYDALGFDVVDEGTGSDGRLWAERSLNR